LQQFREREGWGRINDRLLEICSWLEVKGLLGGTNEDLEKVRAKDSENEKDRKNAIIRGKFKDDEKRHIDEKFLLSANCGQTLQFGTCMKKRRNSTKKRIKYLSLS